MRRPRGPVGERRGRADALDSCDDLLSWYRARARRVGAYGWDGDRPVYYAMEDSASGHVRGEVDVTVAGHRRRRRAARDRHQRPGGRRRRARRGQDRRHAAGAGASGTACCVTTSPATSRGRSAPTRSPDSIFDAELLLVGDRVVVIATGVRAFGGPVEESWDLRRTGPTVSQSRVLVLDVADPAADRWSTRPTSPARCVSARQTATRSGWSRRPGPALRLRVPRRRHRQDAALDRNRASCGPAPSTTGCRTVDDGTGPATASAGRLRPGAAPDARRRRSARSRSSASTSPTPTRASTTAVTADSDIVYSSTDQLYLATTAVPQRAGSACWAPATDRRARAPDGTHRPLRLRPRRHRRDVRRLRRGATA